MIFAPDGDPAQSALGRVVVDRDVGILEEAAKPPPDPVRIKDGPPERRLRQHTLREHPAMDVVDRFA